MTEELETRHVTISPNQILELRGEGHIRSDAADDYPTEVIVEPYTGTWNLGTGVYRVVFEVEFELEEGELAIVKPLNRLSKVGGVMPIRIYTEEVERIVITMNVIKSLKIDVDADIAEIFVG